MTELREEDEAAGRDPINAIIFSEEMGNYEFQQLVRNDQSYAVFSVTFVLFYFVVHLRSFFLAVIGVLLISFSFGVTHLICMGVARVTYYSGLHSLVIFIVLGIAADNIFVLIDAWR